MSMPPSAGRSFPFGFIADRLMKGIWPEGLERGSRAIRLPGSRSWRERAAGLPNVLGRIGSLEVRLAVRRRDVKEAQRLRYTVFYEEMNAVPDMVSRLKRRDVDAYDAFCDHLLVIDHAAPPRIVVGRRGAERVPAIVGTYRLLRGDLADTAGGFYSAREFDIEPLLRAHPDRRFLELGRSCVLPAYRDRRTIELLWHGIWAYVLHHRIDVMFGCASLEGTDIARHAGVLGLLHETARAPEGWRVRAAPGRGVPMVLPNGMAVDARRALKDLPPLVKGYLRLGARVGEEAVVDHQFGTTDVLVVLPREFISERYIGHFGADAGRYAA